MRWLLASTIAVSISTLGAVAPALAFQQSDSTAENETSLPLEAGRTIHYDMREGSWISLDVSPDGRTIVFDYLGNLFTLPIGGGEATQLTSGMAVDAQPRFSPDGQDIVFTSDRDGGQNLWLMSLDGSDTTQITKGKTNRTESPEWTPDGQYIVASVGDFRGSDLPVLHLYHIEGGSGIKLMSEPERLKTMGAAFGADDRYIWFAQRTGDWTYNAQGPQYQLAVYDRETGRRYTRTSRGGAGIRPTLSPDGRWLVYGTRLEDQTGLMLRDLESGDERWLAYPVQHDDMESRGTFDLLPGMSFTPDSRNLVASYGGKMWSIPIAGGEATEIPFHVEFDLGIGPAVDFDYPVDDSPTFVVRQIRDAVPSPDGRRIAFTAMDHLYVANADASDAERLTDGEGAEHYPAWSPDGRWIAYATWDDGEGGLRKVRSSGGNPVDLTRTGGVYTSPTWSPDGERVVAVRGPARAFQESTGARGALGAVTELIWVPQDGGDATVISPLEGRSRPHFTANPDRIYLYSNEDGVVSIRWDGTDEKSHVKVRGATPPGSSEPTNAGLVLMAPTGDQALAVVTGQVYVVTVPVVGGETPTISVAKPANAEFPAKKLTEIGGEFAAWGADGRTVHWSLGNAFFSYNLDAARVFEDSVEAAGDEEAVDEDEEEEDEDEEDAPARFEATEVRMTLTAERDIPQGVVVLRGARVITMVGDEVIANADIVVSNNRIEAVGAQGSVNVPADARVIDVSGTTIIPGLVDTHAHLRPAFGVHRRDAWVYLANLAYGVTTTRDPQTGTTDVLTYADRVRAGDMLGPRIYSTGPGIFWGGGFDSLDDTRKILRRYSDYYDTKTLKMYVAGNRRQRQWIIMAARELGIMPTTEGSLNIRLNISATIDGYPGHEHSLPIYPLYGDMVKLYAESGRVYTPTLLVSYGGPWAENYFYETEEVHDDAKLNRFTPHQVVDGVTLRRSQWFRTEQHVFQDHAKFVADLVAAGGRAGVGSHGQLQGLGYHWELWALQSGGLSTHDALRVATVFGADAVGLGQDLGSVATGKLADLVVLEANPLDDIRNTNTIRYVMKNGRLYEGDTLREIYPRERELEPLWWWNSSPRGLPGVGATGSGR
ncbi:MAG: amidohydrolase family protein [Gemmatimonadetes bacterium]|nr:amidohydrolase family protein [Gemmatimonadota bacterium]